MHHLLVPLAPGESAEPALSLAEAVRRSSGARMTLLTAVDAASEEGEARGKLESLARSVDGPVEVLVKVGSAPAVIASQLMNGAASLVVMGTRGQTPLRRLILGSVLRRVVRQVRVPILAVPPGANPPLPRRILIAMDGSLRSARVLGPAMALGRLFGATFQIVTVLGPESGSPVPPSMASAHIRSVRHLLREAGFDAGVEYRVGGSVSEISSAAREWKADLIAVATRGLTLPGVTTCLLDFEERPLLIIRQDLGKMLPRWTPQGSRSEVGSVPRPMQS